jgi:hypothetical protein
MKNEEGLAPQGWSFLLLFRQHPVSADAFVSHWRKFIEAVQPTAKNILGHGLYDGGAQDIEAGGQDRKGTPAKRFLSRLKKTAKKQN